MIPSNRKSTHPGEVLLEEFLNPMGITQVKLAAHLGVPIQHSGSTSWSGASVASRPKQPGFCLERSVLLRSSGLIFKRPMT